MIGIITTPTIRIIFVCNDKDLKGFFKICSVNKINAALIMNKTNDNVLKMTL